MFDSLSSRIQNAFTALRGEVRLTETQVEDVLREIRLALLEADVNFNVVKAFIDRVRDRAMDQAVLRSLSPAQQVVKIVRDELLALFAGTEGGLTKDAPKPRVVLLLGLQGAGKTTTSAKLGRWLKRQGQNPVMVSTDVRRPAAIQQLEIVGEQAGVKVYAPDTMDPVARAKGALAEARAKGHDTVIVDTAGRLHIDDDLMVELQAIKDAVQPSDLLYVADSMTGQDAIKSAGEFNRRVGVTGVVLTKLDGDARGGAALSVVSVVGVPIAFTAAARRSTTSSSFIRIASSRACSAWATSSRSSRRPSRPSTGRSRGSSKRSSQEQVHARRLPQAAQDHQAHGPARKRARDDSRHGAAETAAENRPDEKQLSRVEAIISSMTAAERRDESLLNGSRRKRIAAGSGTSVEDVNRLVKQFGEMKKVLQMMGGMQALQQGPGGKRVMPSQQQLQEMQQQMRKGGLPGGKKKKGGPWGLIKAR
jgi:signal recognition particle subunit SRP54